MVVIVQTGKNKYRRKKSINNILSHIPIPGHFQCILLSCYIQSLCQSIRHMSLLLHSFPLSVNPTSVTRPTFSLFFSLSDICHSSYIQSLCQSIRHLSLVLHSVPLSVHPTSALVLHSVSLSVHPTFVTRLTFSPFVSPSDICHSSYIQSLCQSIRHLSLVLHSVPLSVHPTSVTRPTFSPFISPSDICHSSYIQSFCQSIRHLSLVLHSVPLSVHPTSALVLHSVSLSVHPTSVTRLTFSPFVSPSDICHSSYTQSLCNICYSSYIQSLCQSIRHLSLSFTQFLC